MPFPGDPILHAYRQGVSVVLVTGRSLRDLCLNEEGKIWPILEVLRRELWRRFGLVLVTYSLAEGVRWNPQGLDEGTRRTVERLLESHGLRGQAAGDQEVVRVVRGIASIARAGSPSDENRLRLAFLLEFTEHLAPAAPATTAGLPLEHLVVAELTHLLAHSLAVRNSGHFVMLSGREGLMDQLVSRAVPRIRLRQPDPQEKEAFVGALVRLYTNARLREGLDVRDVVHLTTNTPNRLVEQVFRISHRTGEEITAELLTREKAQAVEELSEDTLSLLDVQRVEAVELVGRNVQKPLTVLRQFAAGLARGDGAVPVAVLLVGPPGAGKTDLALLAAREAGVPAFQMHSPKGPFVGQTESRVRLQQTLLQEWTPNIAVVDELDAAIPVDRPELDTDSGASRAVHAALLSALSDASRRGRSMLVGTTNCPWRMSAAMRSRFRRLPVLFPLREDFPEILRNMARRVDPDCLPDPSHPLVREAADLFYLKRASPREVLEALADVRRRRGGLDENGIAEAARNHIPSVDALSIVYADLWAVRVTAFLSDLPWYENPRDYPFPDHFKDLVSRETGEVDLRRLEEELHRLAPHARL